MFKTMMTAAFAVATLAAPAIAQTTGSGSMGSGSMGGSQTGDMGSGSMSGAQTGTMSTDGATDTRTMAPAPRLTRAQLAAAKRCQTMTPARMARNATCVKMQHAHPEMMAPSGM